MSSNIKSEKVKATLTVAKDAIIAQKQDDCIAKLDEGIDEHQKRITYIHTYIRLLTTSPKGLFSANYKEKDKNKNIYKLFKVTIANH